MPFSSSTQTSSKNCRAETEILIWWELESLSKQFQGNHSMGKKKEKLFFSTYERKGICRLTNLTSHGSFEDLEGYSGAGYC